MLSFISQISILKNLSNKKANSILILKIQNNFLIKFHSFSKKNFCISSEPTKKLNYKKTSEINKTNTNLNILKEYRDKIDNSTFIFEEIFQPHLKSRENLFEYFDIENISKNLNIKGQIPIDSTNKSILEPGWDMINRTSKKWRCILGLIIMDLFKIDTTNPRENKTNLYYRIFFLVESLHNASLIIDDVEDKSEFRRDLPCVHLKFGEAISINAGISMFFFVINKIIQNIQDPKIISELSKIYFQEMTALSLGQGWDIEMKVDVCIPLKDNYIDTVLLKTGVFPRFMAKLLSVLIRKEFENNKILNSEKLDFIFSNLFDILDNLSIAFQIKDDLLNITDSELSRRKGFFGEDIFEGKLTLMVLHSLNEKNEKKNRLKEILGMNTKDSQLIKEAVDILNENGSILHAENIMKNHNDKSIELSDCLIDYIENNGLNSILDLNAVESLKLLMNYLTSRSI